LQVILPLRIAAIAIGEALRDGERLAVRLERFGQRVLQQ